MVPRYPRSLLCLVAITAALSVLLVGCASPPERSAPPDIAWPDQWSTPADVAAPGPWLASFGDPRLVSLIREALGHNAGLDRATAVLSQRIAEARIAGADRAPEAALGAGGARQRLSTFGPTATGGVIFENYDLGLNLSWELDIWGRLRDLQSGARARIDLGEAELAAARLSLAAQVTRDWLNWSEAQLQTREAARTAEAYRSDLRSLEDRFARGLAGGGELRRIRSQAAAAEAELAAWEDQMDAAVRRLEVLMGRYPSGQLEASPTLPTLPDRPPAGLPAELITRRPDLMAAERALAAADSELAASRKAWLPRIALTGSGGTASQEMNRLLDGDFRVWSLAANLTQPIFEGGRIRANIDRATALRDQARAAYRDAVLQAFFEVERALASEASLQTQYQQLTIAADEAAAAEALLRDRYRQGTADFLEVLDAQRSAASVRGQILRVHNRLLQNRVQLHLALGGSFALEI